MQRCLVGMLVLLFACKVWSQERIAFEHLSVAEGLSNNDVREIVQGKQGELWIGTSDGLNRYDGYALKLFRNTRKDSTTLRGNFIEKLFVDRDGVLWVIANSYLHRYNPKQNTFTPYPLPKIEGQPTLRTSIRCMTQSKDGSLWIGTTEALYRFSDRTFEKFIPPPSPEEPNPLFANAVYSLLADTVENYLWCGSRGGVQRFDTRRKEFTRYSLAENGIAEDKIVSIVFGNNDTLWLSSSRLTNPIQNVHTGIIAFNRRTGAHQRCVLNSQSGATTSLDVNRLATDKDGWIWAATSAGLYKFNPQMHQVMQFQHDPKNPQSLGENLLATVFCDASGVIWAGGETSGLSKYAPYRQKFQVYRNNPYDDNSLSNNYARGITEDDDGNIFIATQFGGLNKLNRRTGQWTRFRGDTTAKNSLITDNTRALFKDQDGSLWIGSHYPASLSRLNPKTNVIERVSSYPPVAPVGLFYLARNGEIWIGNESQLMMLLSQDRKLLRRRFLNVIRANEIINVQAILEDRFGDVWLGTEFGLFQLDSTFRLKQKYFYSITDSTTIGNDIISHLMESSQGELWVATKGGGIARYNRSTRHFERITDADGLPHNNTYAILEDRKGNFWISTDNGICEFNPTTKAFRKFTVADGLQGKEFNRFSYFKSKRGEFFFGGTNGVNSFFPEHIKLNPNAPKVALTGIKIGNQVQPFGIDDDTLQFSNDQNELTFELTAFEFTSPERNRYACFLEGYDKTWRDLGIMRDASYTNLDAGDYTLHVKAANSDGIWSNDHVVLRLHIEPLFWERWWFRAMATLGIAGCIFAVYQVRIQRIETQNRMLEAIVRKSTEEILEQNKKLAYTNEQLADALAAAEAEQKRAETANKFKTELIGIVAHDLKNPLQSILGFSSLMKEEPLNSPTEFASHIQRAANRMLKLVDDLLQSAAVESGQLAMQSEALDVSLLVQGSVNDNLQLAAQKSQKILFEGDAETAIYGDAARLREVMENLISNAVKFSPVGTTIWTSVKKIPVTESRMRRAVDSSLPGVVRIMVKDEGQGLTEKDMDKLFGKFQKLSAKPTGGETSTGLGLSIVKQIVELHGGKVWAESDGKGKGSMFFIDLPALLKDELPLVGLSMRARDEKV